MTVRDSWERPARCRRLLAEDGVQQAREALVDLVAAQRVELAIGIAVAVLVFDRAGSYASPESVVDGARAALFVAAVMAVLGALAALGIPAQARKRRVVARRVLHGSS